MTTIAISGRRATYPEVGRLVVARKWLKAPSNGVNLRYESKLWAATNVPPNNHGRGRVQSRGPRNPSLSQQAATQNLSERRPRVGELVQVRSRRWLVDEVIEPKGTGQTCLVRLSCADDDAQGQSLEVLWDYELDRLILEFPDGSMSASGLLPRLRRSASARQPSLASRAKAGGRCRD
jgi:hypothetical protein